MPSLYACCHSPSGSALHLESTTLPLGIPGARRRGAPTRGRAPPRPGAVPGRSLNTPAAVAGICAAVRPWTAPRNRRIRPLPLAMWTARESGEAESRRRLLRVMQIFEAARKPSHPPLPIPVAHPACRPGASAAGPRCLAYGPQTLAAPAATAAQAVGPRARPTLE